MKRFLINFLAIVGTMTLIMVIAVVYLLRTAQFPGVQLADNSVLYINFPQQIVEFERTDLMGQLISKKQPSLKEITDAIDTASTDDQIIGIVARLDHASMGVAQAQEIRDAIKRFRALNPNKKKFTIAYADTFGELTAGTIQYYIAAPFEEVWVQPNSAVGLTGLYVTIPFARDMINKLGLQPSVHKREEYKSVLETVTESKISEANKQATKEILRSIFDQIVRDIAADRQMPETKVRSAIDRAPLLAQEAKDLGLINGMAYQDNIAKNLKNKFGDKIAFVSTQKYLAAKPPLAPKVGRAKIALIFGEGIIMRDSPDNSNYLGNMVMGGNELEHQFRAAIRDPDVRAIVFRINSGGGSPTASETIWRATMLAKEHKIPVIVSMSDTAASGGYWIAAHATKIVAHPGTITGSIGVVSGKMVTKDLWNNLGVNWEAMQFGQNANMWSTLEDFSPVGMRRLQTWLDNIYETFVHKVASGRGLSADHVRNVAKGRVWTGEQALGHKLVDKLGDLNTAIELAKIEIGMPAQEVPVQVFPKSRTIVEQLLSVFQQDSLEDFGGWSGVGTIAIIHPMLAMAKQLQSYFNTKVLFAVDHAPEPN